MDMPKLPRGYIVEFRYAQRPYPDRPTLPLTILRSRAATDGGCEVIFEGVSNFKVLDLNHLSSGEGVLQAQDVRLPGRAARQSPSPEGGLTVTYWGCGRLNVPRPSTPRDFERGRRPDRSWGRWVRPSVARRTGEGARDDLLKLIGSDISAAEPCHEQPKKPGPGSVIRYKARSPAFAAKYSDDHAFPPGVRRFVPA